MSSPPAPSLFLYKTPCSRACCGADPLHITGAVCKVIDTSTSAAALLTYSHSALSSSSARCSARCSFSIHLINSHQLADSASTLLSSVLAVYLCFLAT